MIQPIETIKIFKRQPELTVPKGEVIFRDGEKGKVMYGIVEGEVEMYVNDKLVEIIEEGDIFGQGALVHEDYSRASTAIAKTDCTLAVLDQERFLFVVQQTPMFALGVMRSYSDRHRRLKSVMDGLIDI
ncbi:unknown [Crocosphaera subtropica ATCC 51142]|uniref:Cyclic nucleotide-binding domain-containing protein n=1 Tax=Crocosphaera subtropica (strain ATCC 51142 / BH68) TaxID=43989 RepID=B1WRR8_CROS5|nr:cyclic nucleotide-binding domain-containing protein [Crocosphaera subtropica]ACB53509.1 unknown [Crocosphaera subtropica ATCC 51142]